MSVVEVLVVEYPAEVRDALAALLNAADGIRVVGVSADADAALRMVVRLAPDIVLVGADLSGAAALTSRIMSEHPTPVVALIEPEDAELGGALLAEGAVSAQLRPRDAAATVRFCSVVRALAEVSVVRRRGGVPRKRSSRIKRQARARDTAAKMVAVAASTGGPVALQRLLANLPEDLPVPILVVQHIVVGFTAGLVDSLRIGSPLPVTLAEDGQVLAAGTVYVAPDGHHLTVTGKGRARLTQEAPVGGFRPSASVLFSSLAAAYGPAGVAVVLTGMGTDGLTGLHDVEAAGGCILTQDEATSAVFGMPGAAVAAGIADITAPVDELGAHIARLADAEGNG